MPSFRTAVVESETNARQRLADFGLTIEQIVAIAKVARTWADDASPLMPLNAPGTLAYIFGVQELRQQIVNEVWVVDRSCGIEAVINRELGVRIAYQNVDRACDPHLPPNPRSTKGSGAESICGPTLFEHAGIEAGPLTGVTDDAISTYYVMVGDEGGVELSHPVIRNGSYSRFNERIFVYSPNRDWEETIEPETSPIEDFEIPVSFKEQR